MQLRPPPRPQCAPPAPVAVSAAASRQTGTAANIGGSALKVLTDSALTVRVPRLLLRGLQCGPCGCTHLAAAVYELALNDEGCCAQQPARGDVCEVKGMEWVGVAAHRVRVCVCRRVPACCSDCACVAAGQRGETYAADALPARARRRTFCNSYVVVWVGPQLSQATCTGCKCTHRWQRCFGAMHMHGRLGKGRRSLTLKCILADVTHGCQLCQQLQKPCAAQQHRQRSMGRVQV